MVRSQKPLLLVGESFSPWTKKARWALEYCGVDHAYQEYTPTLSEPALRWRLGQWTGSVSVPVLFGREVVRGSWDIARYANRVAGDARLGDFEANSVWNDLSEAALAEGRTRVVRCILQDDEALVESLPSWVPSQLRRSLRFVARDAVQRLDRKYAHLLKPGALRHALLQTRNRLAEIHGDYLLGGFTYADIAMAVVLEVVAPAARAEPPLGPATQACWHDAALTEEFQDLVQWRNRLAAAEPTSYSQFHWPFA